MEFNEKVLDIIAEVADDDMCEIKSRYSYF